jgi:hypothetical protein
MRALKRKPADRFDTIESMLKELEALRNTPTADDADAPTQNAPISSLLGSDAADMAKLHVRDGAKSQTDRVVVNVPAPAAAPEPSPQPSPNAPPPDESSVTRPRQVGVQTIPIPQSVPLIAPPPPPGPVAPPSLRLAPPPVPPKLPPAVATPGVDDDVPAYLRNTGQNRPIAAGVDDGLPAQLRNTAQNRAVAAPSPGVDDDLPAHLRNTSRTRGLPAQMPVSPVVGTAKKSGGGISFGAAIISMTITLIAGLVAGWIIHASLSGVSPLEMPARNVPKR